MVTPTVCFVICIHSVTNAFHSKVNWLSGYKIKIPVNKLTFGKRRTTYIIKAKLLCAEYGLAARSM